MLNGLCVEDAAQAAGVSVRTAYKWLRRFREGASRACWIAHHARTHALMPLQAP
ncbi:helix-turn-helix domain-containing protein [Pseudomonas oryzae]|uniref:helix-turn-helix domain-containing protein n=1 Tax=Pseudomonas oryzae TaxID=1392877 RepID=UPI000B83E26C